MPYKILSLRKKLQSPLDWQHQFKIKTIKSRTIFYGHLLGKICLNSHMQIQRGFKKKKKAIEVLYSSTKGVSDSDRILYPEGHHTT